ncbi:MAG: hypothetical protein AAB953_00575 [Patescibacteria group bacterium]
MNTAQELHNEFVRLGGMRLKLKNKMLAILPQIYESGIWKKYAGSIVEYAGKYGDIAQTTTRKRLRLESNLDDLPCLKAAIEKVGVHKVAMVAKIATPETDQALAESILNMSKAAVQSLSKELRAKHQAKNVNDGQQLAFFDYDSTRQNQEPLCKAVAINKKIELDEESTFLFMKLKAKLGKQLSDKEFLKLILEERAKQEFQNEATTKEMKTSDYKSITGDTFPETRYIHANKKREVIAKTNGKCTYPGCNLPCEILHHPDRYSESKSHDSVITLCKIHHEFAHNNLIQNETQLADQWRISVIKEPATKISQADILYKKYRREALA